MQVHLDRAYALALVANFFLPVLVGLVTTRVTSAGLKAVLLLALSAASGFVVELANAGPGYSVTTGVILTVVAFVQGVAAHFGFWKPVGVATKAQDAFAKAA
ncbi:hypothetical protein [Streptomyces sp. STR69]|uniref:hypothetical protein n=1 Tax=Streptomyces sp. STR69 TaxID=1796942 RepID=UPI0021C5B312|nr:hypothetical protein [Streptomyces sp. STR69]